MKKFKLKMILILLVSSLGAICSGTLILEPKNRNGLEAGFVLVQGAQIDTRNYKEFGVTLQTKFPGRLWVAITQFPLNNPEPLQIGEQISTAIENIKKAGCNISKEMPFFFVGHSLGGIVLEDYILDDSTRNSLPVKVAGLILEGSYVVRKNRDKVMNDLSLPNILTIGGELDGLNRITRMAEAFYFDMKNPRSSNLEILTLIVKGMNHYQFAGEGQPPSLVKQNDITPEITDSEARDQLTSLLNSFMKISMLVSDDNDKTLIQNQLNQTSDLLNPLIEAFKLEGYYNLLAPCYKVPVGKNCTVGCPWTLYSQQIMGKGFLKLNYSITGQDLFFPASQIIPDPLPQIHNNCYNPPTNSCHLNISTVSEAVYANGAEMDTSFLPIAATEIKSKLMSRQSVLMAVTGLKFDFKQTDGADLCGVINNNSINLALSMAHEKTIERYYQKGRLLEIGKDIDMSNEGPLWIWSSLVSFK